MPFSKGDRQAAQRARAAAHGRARAAFWRALGWPNLARAREARRRNCEQRRAALTEAERCKQLAAGERWRKWREGQQEMKLKRTDPALWGFVRSLAARPEPSARALARQVRVSEKQLKRAERMLGARERRNARVRQRRRMQCHEVAARAVVPPAIPATEPRQGPLRAPEPPNKPAAAAQAVPIYSPGHPGFVDMPLAGGGTRRVFCW